MTPEGKILNARLKLRKEYEYVADVLIYLRPIVQEAIGTMAVNAGDDLMYNPKWVDTLTALNVIAVVVHEILHKVLLHMYRLPADIMAKIKNGSELTDYDQYRCRIHNYACDLQVNYMSHEIGTFKDLPETDFKPSSSGYWSHLLPSGKRITINRIGEKSLEQIYKELLDDMPEEDSKGFKSSGDHGPWVVCSGSGDGDGDGEAGEGHSLQEAAGDWMIRVAGLLTNQAGKGTMPAGLVRELERLLEPQVDWTGKLERFVEPICAGEYSFRRPRRSSWSLGVIMPGPDGAGVHIIAHVDTSGSMQKQELEQILGELYGILDAYPHVAITLLHSDAAEPVVTHLREVDKEDLNNIVKLNGGGGTSHRPVVKWVQEHNEDELKALICFTDGLSDIQHCFNELDGAVYRMLVLTRKEQIKKLEPHCEETAYLPCHN